MRALLVALSLSLFGWASEATKLLGYCSDYSTVTGCVVHLDGTVTHPYSVGTAMMRKWAASREEWMATGVTRGGSSKIHILNFLTGEESESPELGFIPVLGTTFQTEPWQLLIARKAHNPQELQFKILDLQSGIVGETVFSMPELVQNHQWSAGSMLLSGDTVALFQACPTQPKKTVLQFALVDTDSWGIRMRTPELSEELFATCIHTPVVIQEDFLVAFATSKLTDTSYMVSVNLRTGETKPLSPPLKGEVRHAHYSPTTNAVYTATGDHLMILDLQNAKIIKEEVQLPPLGVFTSLVDYPGWKEAGPWRTTPVEEESSADSTKEEL